jgi:hypothetical protein
VGFPVWWSPDEYRCGGRRTSTFYFENISKQIPFIRIKSRDSGDYYDAMYGRTKSRDGGHYYARERTLLTQFSWDRTLVWWSLDGVVVAGQVPVWWSLDKYFLF